MRKHFLILMLLTLLPLAGFADNIVIVPTVIDKKYGETDPGSAFGGYDAINNPNGVKETMFYVASPAVLPNDGSATPVQLTLADIAKCLKVVRAANSTGEGVGSYKYLFAVDKSQRENFGNHNIIVQQNGDLNISKGAATISGLDLAAWTYGEDANQPTFTSVKIGDTNATEFLSITYSTTEDGEYGTYESVVNGQGGDYYVKAAIAATDNYTGTEAKKAFVINPKAISEAAITEDAQTITFGDPDATFTITMDEDELVEGDNIANNFTVKVSADAAGLPSAKGVYTVKVFPKNGNYSITVTDQATYTINARAINAEGIAITNAASLPSKVYKAAAWELTTVDTPAQGDNPAVPAELQVWDGNTRLVVGTDFQVVTTNNTNVGTATITITGAGNYETEAENTLTATFEITTAPLNVALVNPAQIRAYGDVWDHTVAITDTDWQSADDKNNFETAVAADATLMPTADITGEDDYDDANKLVPGTHNVTISGGTAPANYHFVYARNNTVTVGKAEITIALKAGVEVEWNNDQTAQAIINALTNAYTVTGGPAVGTDVLFAGGSKPIVISAAAEIAENYKPGDYAITFQSHGATLADEYKEKYSLAWDDAATTFKINKKAGLKITALNQTVEKVDNAADSDFEGDAILNTTYTLSGFASGENATNLSVDLSTLAITVAEINTKLTTAGEYNEAITLAGAASDYYDLTAAYVKGNLVVAGEGMILTLAQNSDAAEKIKAADESEVNTVKVTVNRNQTIGSDTYTWDAQEFNALVLPFNVTVTELSEQFGYAVVNVVKPSSTTPGKIYFALEWGTIPANTPFVVRTRDNVENKTLTFANKEIVWSANPFALAGPANVDAANQYKFVGTYSTYTITGASHGNQRFFGDNTDHGVGTTNPSTTATWDIVPFDAYLDYQSYFGTVGAHDVTLVFEDLNGGTTSINAAEFSRKAVSAEGWYTLNGVKLQGVPTEKGVYIQNGKKVVIK